MNDKTKLMMGDLVKHTVSGYIGVCDGETKMEKIFEKPTDKIGYRIMISQTDRPLIASPDNLELVAREGDLIRNKLSGEYCISEGATLNKKTFASPIENICLRLRSLIGNKTDIVSIDKLECLGMLLLEEKHKIILEARGIEWKGVRKRGAAVQMTPRHRRPKCWFCKQALDNAVDIECLSCGWILCRCGACGCGSPICLRHK